MEFVQKKFSLKVVEESPTFGIQKKKRVPLEITNPHNIPERNFHDAL